MARARQRKLESPSDTATAETTREPDVFDEQIEARRQEQAAAVLQQVAAATELPSEHGHPEAHTHHHSGHASKHTPSRGGHAATVEPRKFTPPADPFGTENIKAGENRVQLLKSEGHGAWVIRFAHNPNQDPGPNGETYSKENPHPVLKMLKEEGYRWGFDSGDGKGGWGKAFTGDAYGADHIEARKVLQKAADMIGHKVDQGRIPD